MAEEIGVVIVRPIEVLFLKKEEISKKGCMEDIMKRKHTWG